MACSTAFLFSSAVPGRGDGRALKASEDSTGCALVGSPLISAARTSSSRRQCLRGFHGYGEFQLGKCGRIRQFDADGLQRPEFRVVPVTGPGLAVILAPPPDQRVDVVAEFREAAQRDPGRGLAAGQWDWRWRE